MANNIQQALAVGQAFIENQMGGQGTAAAGGAESMDVPALSGAVGAVSEYFTIENLNIFQTLLNLVGRAFDAIQTPVDEWPDAIFDAWNKFTRGDFKQLGFFPLVDAQRAFMAQFSPIRAAKRTSVYRAPRGYVVVEFPQGSGQKVAMKKEIARSMSLWKAQPKPLATSSEVRAMQKAKAVEKRIQSFALAKDLACKPIEKRTYKNRSK